MTTSPTPTPSASHPAPPSSPWRILPNTRATRSVPRIAVSAIALTIVSVTAIAATAHASPASSRSRTVHASHTARDVIRTHSRSTAAAEGTAVAAGPRVGVPQESTPSPATTPSTSDIAPADDDTTETTPNNAPVEPVLVVIAVLVFMGLMSAIAAAVVLKRRRPQ